MARFSVHGMAQAGRSLPRYNESRAERELSSLVVSRINGCVYCAAVHASAYNQMTGDTDQMQRILDEGVDTQLRERERAIVPREQRRLVSAIPGAVEHTIDDGHVACAKREFGPALVRAVSSVADRIVLPPQRASG